MTFAEIFAEYYSQFRGQGGSIPSYGAREYTTAIQLANASIREWDRVDGELWRELIDNATAQDVSVWPADQRTVDGLTMTTPNNMRKTPAKVRFSNGDGHFDVTVIPPQEAQKYSPNSSVVWFEGGANNGYTMHLGGSLSTQYAGWTVDYVYYKKPTLFTIATTPATQTPEMSDPGFLINSMLRKRFMNSRNGMGFKIADSNAKQALINMKIENSSGVWGNSDRLRELSGAQGWGVNSGFGEMEL